MSLTYESDGPFLVEQGPHRSESSTTPASVGCRILAEEPQTRGLCAVPPDPARVYIQTDEPSSSFIFDKLCIIASNQRPRKIHHDLDRTYSAVSVNNKARAVRRIHSIRTIFVTYREITAEKPQLGTTFKVGLDFRKTHQTDELAMTGTRRENRLAGSPFILSCDHVHTSPEPGDLVPRAVAIAVVVVVVAVVVPAAARRAMAVMAVVAARRARVPTRPLRDDHRRPWRCDLPVGKQHASTCSGLVRRTAVRGRGGSIPSSGVPSSSGVSSGASVWGRGVRVRRCTAVGVARRCAIRRRSAVWSRDTGGIRRYGTWDGHGGGSHAVRRGHGVHVGRRGTNDAWGAERIVTAAMATVRLVVCVRVGAGRAVRRSVSTADTMTSVRPTKELRLGRCQIVMVIRDEIVRHTLSARECAAAAADSHAALRPYVSSGLPEYCHRR